MVVPHTAIEEAALINSESQICLTAPALTAPTHTDPYSTATTLGVSSEVAALETAAIAIILANRHY